MDGLWFHTLIKAPKAWDVLLCTIRAALRLLEEEAYPEGSPKVAATKRANHSIHFAFCTLQSGSIEREFVIDFRVGWKDQLARELSSVARDLT